MVLIDTVNAVREGNALGLCCRNRVGDAPTRRAIRASNMLRRIFSGCLSFHHSDLNLSITCKLPQTSLSFFISDYLYVKPDVVTGKSYTVSWHGVVSPVVCTSGAKVCW